MKNIINRCKDIIKEICGQQKMVVVNCFLLAMLCITCIINVLAVRSNKRAVDERISKLSQVSAGVVEYIDENGEIAYYYAKNGVKNENMTGLGEYIRKNVVLYFDGGEWEKDYNGLSEFMGDMCLVRNGVVDYDFTGITLVNDKAYSITRGRVDTCYNGVVCIEGSYYYLKNGSQDDKLNNFIHVAELDEDVYFENGRCGFDSRVLIGDESNYKLIINNRYYNADYSGAVRDKNDICYMFENGQIDTTYDEKYYWDEGFNQGYYLVKGVTAKKKTLLVPTAKKDRLKYVLKGRRDKTYTGIVEQEGKKYYVKNGDCKLTYSGETEIDGKIYEVENGIVVKEVIDDAKK